MNTNTLPSAADVLLRRFRRRRMALDTVRVALWAVAADLAMAVAAMHIDRFAFLDQRERVALTWACHGSGLLVLAAWMIARLRRHVTPLDLAYAIEARRPELQERLVTVASLAAASPDDGTLRQQLVAETEAASIGIDLNGLVPLTVVRRAAIALAAVVGIHGALALVPGYQYELMARRLLSPRAELPKASFFRLLVRPGNATIASGDDFTVHVEVAGEVPAFLMWIFQRIGMRPTQALVAVGAPGDAPDFTDAVTMSRVQRRLHAWTKRSVDGSFAFCIRLGDTESHVYAVKAVERPRIVDLALAVAPPAYTGRSSELLHPTGSEPIPVLAGSEVELRFRTDRAVIARELTIDGAAPSREPTWDEGANAGTWSATVSADLAIELRVRDAHGFANATPVRLTLSVIPDGKPTVRLDEPADGLALASGELLPVRAVVGDDLGLTGAAFRYQLNPQLDPDVPVQELPLELPVGNPVDTAIATGLDLERTGAMPGDQLVFQLRVRDSAGQDGVSAPVSVRVVPLVRGDDERRRLLSLRLVAEALAAMGTEGESSVPEQLADALVERASKQGLPLEGRPDAESLLALLEREHHLTAAPRHRQDLRRLHGLIGDALLGPGDRSERRNEIVRLIPDLTAARTVANLLARLAGLKAEAQTLRQAIEQVRAAGEGPGSAGRRAALQRRGKLYLAAMEEVGADLLAFVRNRQIDAAATERRVGDLNTAAYQLGRAGSTRSLDACTEAVRLITSQIDELLPLAMTLRVNESAARAALVAAERRARTVLASADAVQPWAMRRVADQVRLISREPFADTMEAALLALAAHSGPGSSSWSSLLSTTPSEGADALGLEWEQQRLAEAQRITAEDRRIALLLIPERSSVRAAPASPALPEPDDLLVTIDARRAALANALATGADLREAVSALERSLAVAPALIAARLEGIPVNADVLEELLVRLRTAAARWMATSAEARDAIASGAGTGNPALTGLITADQGLARAIGDARQRLAANASGAPTFPVLADLARARGLVKATVGDDGRAIRARALLATEPLFARAMLASHESTARSAREAVASLALAWEKPVPDQATAEAARQQAEMALHRIATAIAAAGQIGVAAEEVFRAASERLRAVPVHGEPAPTRLALESALPEFDRLLRHLGNLVDHDARSISFTGGPVMGAHTLARRDAEAMRQEFTALDRHAQAAALAALLDDQRGDEAASWARLGYRLLLSELAGPPAARSIGGGKAIADRLKDWLRREIDEARRETVRDGGLKTYPRPTREYLDTIEDLLRY